MGVTVGVLLALEELALLFQHHHQLHVETHVLVGLGGVIGVLDKFAGILAIKGHIDIVLHPFGVKVFKFPELTGAVHHWSLLAIMVVKKQVGNAGFLGHAGVVGAKGGGNVDNASTVFGGNIVAQNDTEGLSLNGGAVGLLGHVDHRGLHPGNQLPVGNALQSSSLALAQHGGMEEFGLLVGFALGEEVAHQGFGHHYAAWLLGIGMSGIKKYIVDSGAYTKGRVRG